MANGFLRGAAPTPRHRIMAASPFKLIEAPPEFAFVPAKLDYWGNNQYGDCVTAEEAFAKACYDPEIFIEPAVVIAWARKHGVLNGAMLPDVMNDFQKDGFKVGAQQYNDGPYAGVNYGNEEILQSALAQGPVKVALDANALPSGAGNKSGWHATGKGHYPHTDHCVALCGYGSAGFLYNALKVQVPSMFTESTQGYLLFTWGTIGFVDHDWIMSTITEAWLRKPTTIGAPPLPGPKPEVPLDWSQI